MYYFTFCILYLLSLLPFWLIYFISDVLYILLYYVLRYRRRVVFSNLKQAFPEMSENEREQTAKRFYRNLTDQIVETIKMISISKKEIQKRFICDPEIFRYLEEKKMSYQVHLGHVFNWEWRSEEHTSELQSR